MLSAKFNCACVGATITLFTLIGDAISCSTKESLMTLFKTSALNACKKLPYHCITALFSEMSPADVTINSCLVASVAFGNTRKPEPAAVRVQHVIITFGILTLQPVGGKKPTLFVPSKPILMPPVVCHTILPRSSVGAVDSATIEPAPANLS